MKIIKSIIATKGGTVKKSKIDGGDNNDVNITIQYYAVAGVAGFIGGVLASIIANIITG